MAQMAHKNAVFGVCHLRASQTKMLQMLHFFRDFGSVTFGNFGVPIAQNEPYFSIEWDKWDSASGENAISI